MAIRKENELVLEYKYDPRQCRHTLNGQPVVMHCHHYLALFSQLADDVDMLDGARLMAECAEDAFVETFETYFDTHGIVEAPERLGLIEQMYASFGLGAMQILCAGKESGEVVVKHSHVDAGWIKKWGKREKPVNFLTLGFIAAAFASTFGRPARTYNVSEIASIVSGDDVSRFEVVAK